MESEESEEDDGPGRASQRTDRTEKCLKPLQTQSLSDPDATILYPNDHIENEDDDLDSTTLFTEMDEAADLRQSEILAGSIVCSANAPMSMVNIISSTPSKNNPGTALMLMSRQLQASGGLGHESKKTTDVDAVERSFWIVRCLTAVSAA